MRQLARQALGYFVSGVLILLPAAVTIWVIGAVVRAILRVFDPEAGVGQFSRLINIEPGGHLYWLFIAAVSAVVVVLVTLLGMGTSRGARNWIAEAINALFGRFPIVNRIYGALLQVVDVLRGQAAKDVSKFGDVVAVQFANMRVLGVLTSRKIYRISDRDYVQILLPSSPMPMTGFLYFIPIEDVLLCDIGIEDFTKVVVSFGSLTAQILDESIRVRRIRPPFRSDEETPAPDSDSSPED